MAIDDSAENTDSTDVKEERFGLQPLEAEYENAKERLNQQHETLKEFSHEGMRMFRLLLLFVAAPTAVLGALEPSTLHQISSTLTSTECGLAISEDCFLSVGNISILTGFLLILTLGMNLIASGYEARGIHNLTNPEDIHKTITNDESRNEYYQKRLKTYRNRIKHNDRVISGIESLLAVGKVSLWLTTSGVALLAFVLITNSTIGFLWWIFVLFLWFAPMAYPLVHAPQEYKNSDRYLKYNSLYSLNYEKESKNAEERDETETNSDSIEESKKQEEKE